MTCQHPPGLRSRSPAVNVKCLALLTLILVSGCSPSLDQHIESLGGNEEQRDRAKQELLIAKGDAVTVLLAAMENPDRADARPELVEVLASLMIRVDDPRITDTLQRHLLNDPDSAVRARICRELGLYRREELADPFLQSVQEDTSAQVQAAAMNALSRMFGKLSMAQKETLFENARVLYDHESRAVRLEARMLATQRLDRWLEAARGEELKGQVAAAESLHYEALAYSPTSRKANFSLGRFYHRNGQQERGFQLLRDNNSLLDVPRLDAEPEIDGRLDDSVWSQAIETSPFLTYSGDSNASITAEHYTTVRLMYTEDALFLGVHCEDAAPESLVVDEESFAEGSHQDLVEFFLDTGLDQKVICQLKINSVGAVIDGTLPSGDRRNFDTSWNSRSEAAAYVGMDFWSAELKFPFGQLHLPKPEPGTLWGCNMQRGFRVARIWSQWTGNWGGISWMESFGWILFG